MYEVFEHTADLGIRVTAGDLNTLFAEAGRALCTILVGDLDDVGATTSTEFQVTGVDKDFLLVDWLSELLFAFESRKLLLKEFVVTLEADGLSATAYGETYDLNRHRLEHEVKAITYHGLKIEETEDGWLAELIVDI